MKVSIHLTKATGSATTSKGMTLRVDIDAAPDLLAALRKLPGERIDAVIVARKPPVTHAARAARRHAARGGVRHAAAGGQRSPQPASAARESLVH
jgi:hypothetical protein